MAAKRYNSSDTISRVIYGVYNSSTLHNDHDKENIILKIKKTLELKYEKYTGFKADVTWSLVTSRYRMPRYSFQCCSFQCCSFQCCSFQCCSFQCCPFQLRRRDPNTPRGAQGKQPLCTDLLWTTLDAVDYKTGSNTTNIISIVRELCGVTPTICNNINIIRIQ